MPTASITETIIGRLEPAHVTTIEEILRSSGYFREAEIVVAKEVLDAYFEKPEQDYYALGAFTPGGTLLGYVCYGPTPCTVGTYDLYWIAVEPQAQKLGVG